MDFYNFGSAITVVYSSVTSLKVAEYLQKTKNDKLNPRFNTMMSKCNTSNYKEKYRKFDIKGR